MTKAELIRKVAKNVGVPDTDAKIFFELFLKRISAVVEIGQSIFVKDFGYFHLIKGSIKKPVSGFINNQASEEEVEFVLFSEDKDLRKSDTKGLVFNIPSFDEEDYHPVDSIFSLSIGKPLIPLRGVPFDNIYMPTSGYEYRRLIESKVEKIIAASEIAESEENFPTLVIDARSYNSNQVQLQWDDKTRLDKLEKQEDQDELAIEVRSELSEYEKQTKGLKSIAWDFGEDLSRQIEAESILDIADERINIDVNSKSSNKRDDDDSPKEFKIEKEITIKNDFASPITEITEQEFVEEIAIDESSEKLTELLDSENEPAEIFEQEILEKNIPDNYEDTIEEIKIELVNDDTYEEEKSDFIENVSVGNEISDEEFWKNTSKYFEPYNPGIEKKSEEEFEEVKSNFDNLGIFDSKEIDRKMDKEIRNENLSDIVNDDGPILEKSTEEIGNVIQENIVDAHIEDDRIELETADEPETEYLTTVKKKNLIPFIVFPLLVIGLSIALYWYLEYYKKSKVIPESTQIFLKLNNTRIVKRNFDIPVTYPYMPKVSETSISETVPPKDEDQSIALDKNETVKTEPVKTEIKSFEKEIPKQNVTETKEPVKPIIPTGKSLNVGNNIYKYGNYFVVQVAAFRSSSISENEAGKYRNKGYNAFVEAAEIPGRGTWYRVRVGKFSTKEEAQDFIKKNIR